MMYRAHERNDFRACAGLVRIAEPNEPETGAISRDDVWCASTRSYIGAVAGYIARSVPLTRRLIR